MAAKTGKRRRVSDENQTGQGVPHDLIGEIFERLPAKSIGRFRCLSKHWLSCLSNPEFIDRHAMEAKENPNVPLKLFTYVQETSSLYKLNPETYIGLTHGETSGIIHNADKMELPDREPGPDGYWMVGSCNGLVCLQRRGRPMSPNKGETFFVLNPLTGESRQLFYAFYDHTDPYRQQYESIQVGFGYDSSTKDYKIVRFKSNIHNNYVFKIFSLKQKNNRWRTIQQSSPLGPYPYPLRRTLGVEVSGFLHWEQIYNGKIFTFDLAQEKGRALKVPKCNNLSGLGVLDGCLCVTVGSPPNQCVIWMMKEYGVAESWIKLIQLSGIPSFGNRLPFQLSPICYTKKGRVLLLKQNYVGFLYNLQDKTCGTFWFPKVFRELTAGFETLISPNPSCFHN